MSSRSVCGLLGLVLLAGCAAEPTPVDAGPPRASRFVTDPPGASVFVEGAFVGMTPTQKLLPAKPRIRVRIELPDYTRIDEAVDRRLGLPADAPEGTGWEELYYWTLKPR
jgi:hypothetical protein